MDIKTFAQKYKGLIAVVALTAGFMVYETGEKEEPEQSSFVLEVEQGHEEKEQSAEIAKAESEPQTAGIILVDLKGAVSKPGIYQMRTGARIHDAVNKAGGFLKEADQTKVNLAQKLQDEMVVYVPKIGEEQTVMPVPAPSAAASAGVSAASDGGASLININTAMLEQLQELPGIGEAKAQAIIEYRETNGPFQKPEDMQNVTGIGGKTFEKFKNRVSI